jgi:hypothetical protein
VITSNLHTFLAIQVNLLQIIIKKIFVFFVGNSDLNNGLEFGWLYSLSVMTKQPYRQQILYSQDNTTVIDVIFTVRYSLLKKDHSRKDHKQLRKKLKIRNVL